LHDAHDAWLVTPVWFLAKVEVRPFFRFSFFGTSSASEKNYFCPFSGGKIFRPGLPIQAPTMTPNAIPVGQPAKTADPQKSQRTAGVFPQRKMRHKQHRARPLFAPFSPSAPL
jgi:hypothetical protein